MVDKARKNSNTFMKYLFLFIFLLLSPQIGECQYTETISSNRPGVTNSPNTVGAGVLQFELGFDSFLDQMTDSDTGDLYSVGTNLAFRFGMTETFEIRTTLNYQLDLPLEGNSSAFENGIKPSQVLLIANLLPNPEGWIPALGMGAGWLVQIPSDADSLTNAAPYFQIMTNHNLGNSPIGFGSNWGVVYDGITSTPTWQYGLLLSFPLARNGRWSGFIEHYGEWRKQEWIRYFDAGWAVLLHEEVQFDLAGGMGINGSLLEAYASLGFSWRWVLGKK